MSPLSLILDIKDNYNVPIGAIIEALKVPLIITDGTKYYKVLSYYYQDEKSCFVMDIAPKRKSKGSR